MTTIIKYKAASFNGVAIINDNPEPKAQKKIDKFFMLLKRLKAEFV